MSVAGTVLFAFYALLGLLFVSATRSWLGLLGVPLLVLTQYFVTIRLALWRLGGNGVTREKMPELYERVELLAEEMNVAMPEIYIGDMATMNALALGRRKRGGIVLSQSLIRQLGDEELEGVIAHELSHLKNRDSIITNLGNSIAVLFSSGILLIFFLVSLDSEHPHLVQLVGVVTSAIVHLFIQIFVRAISRYREYVADDDAVRATGNPRAMISGLEKVRKENQRPDAPDVNPNLSALCFSGGKRGVLAFLLSTHPSMEKRIQRIRTNYLE